MLKFAIAAAVALLSASPVLAECYDIGCTDQDRFDRSDLREWSCDDLWVARNTIYFEHGYCFKTDAAIEYFGNDQCYVENANRLNFSRIEQHNIDAIATVEKSRRCPK